MLKPIGPAMADVVAKAKPEAPDYEFHRDGMWATDDTYRATARALRDIRDGKSPRPVPQGVEFKGNDKIYRGI